MLRYLDVPISPMLFWIRGCRMSRAVRRIQKTSVGLPRPVWEAAKIRAMREGRTLAEVVAEALSAFLRARRA
jgi:hypothetical protein